MGTTTHLCNGALILALLQCHVLSICLYTMLLCQQGRQLLLEIINSRAAVASVAAACVWLVAWLKRISTAACAAPLLQVFWWRQVVCLDVLPAVVQQLHQQIGSAVQLCQTAAQLLPAVLHVLELNCCVLLLLFNDVLRTLCLNIVWCSWACIPSTWWVCILGLLLFSTGSCCFCHDAEAATSIMDPNYSIL